MRTHTPVCRPRRLSVARWCPCTLYCAVRLSERLVDGVAADACLTGYPCHRDALRVSGDYFGGLLGREGWWAVSTLAGCLGCGNALLPSFVDGGPDY